MSWWPFGGTAQQQQQQKQQQGAQGTCPSPLLPPTTPPPPTNASPTSTSTPQPSTPPPQDTETIDPAVNIWLSLDQPGTQSAPTPTPSAFPPRPHGKLDISPWALRPRSMNCRNAFDAAFHCASLGGKFNDIYRYGALQPCSEHWAAFWFCMRAKNYGDGERGELVADYHARREARERVSRAGGRSSEDVWELRTEPVERAFWRRL